MFKGECKDMPAESKGQNQGENLGAIIDGIRPETAAVLNRALSGEDITSEEAVVLFGAEGQEYNAMVMTAAVTRQRYRHLRGQPKHQFHQRLYQTLRLLRLQPRLQTRGRLLAPGRRDHPAG
jgi:hypothetical protein